MSTITIDGHAYNVPIVSMSMTSDPLEKSAERTANGKLHVERIGVFDNFTLQFAAPRSLAEVTELAALCVVITSATVFHSVLIPGVNGGVAWQAYFAGVKRDLRKRVSTTMFWKNLSCSVIAQSPTRT